MNNESGEPVDEIALSQLGRFVLDRMGIDPFAELSVVLLDVTAMSALHRQWMDLPGPTDVMAFPMDGAEAMPDRIDPSAPPGAPRRVGEAMLGDVVLCPVVAADQAASAGHSTDAELHLLCTHGILHLLGYDHGDEQTEREMFELQTGIVTAWAQHSGRGPIRTPRPGTGGEVRDSPGGRR